MSKDYGPAREFALRLTKRLLRTFVIPLTVSMPVTGLSMIWVGQLEWMRFWLLAAITLYVAAIAVEVGLQRPTVARAIRLTSRHDETGAAQSAGTASTSELGVVVQQSQRLGQVVGGSSF